MLLVERPSIACIIQKLHNNSLQSRMLLEIGNLLKHSHRIHTSDQILDRDHLNNDHLLSVDLLHIKDQVHSRDLHNSDAQVQSKGNHSLNVLVHPQVQRILKDRGASIDQTIANLNMELRQVMINNSMVHQDLKPEHRKTKASSRVLDKVAKLNTVHHPLLRSKLPINRKRGQQRTRSRRRKTFKIPRLELTTRTSK